MLETLLSWEACKGFRLSKSVLLHLANKDNDVGLYVLLLPEDSVPRTVACFLGRYAFYNDE